VDHVLDYRKPGASKETMPDKDVMISEMADEIFRSTFAGTAMPNPNSDEPLVLDDASNFERAERRRRKQERRDYETPEQRLQRKLKLQHKTE